MKTPIQKLQRQWAERERFAGYGKPALAHEYEQFMLRLMAECGVSVPEYIRSEIVQDFRDSLMTLRVEVPIPLGAIEKAAAGLPRPMPPAQPVQEQNAEAEKESAEVG